VVLEVVPEVLQFQHLPRHLDESAVLAVIMVAVVVEQRTLTVLNSVELVHLEP
jgi:hypothetical protein